MTVIVERRPIPRQVRRASQIIGFGAAWNTILLFSILVLSSWELAALACPFVVLYWALFHYLRVGSQWARIVSVVFAAIGLALGVFGLCVYLFTPYVFTTVWLLGGVTINTLICVSLASRDASEFFSTSGRAVHRYESDVHIREAAAIRARSLHAATPQSPGWYPAPGNPNNQVYWDGVSWTAQRRWTAAGYVDMPPEPVAADPAPRTGVIDKTPSRRSQVLVGATYWACALVPPTLAILTIQHDASSLLRGVNFP